MSEANAPRRRARSTRQIVLLTTLALLFVAACAVVVAIGVRRYQSATDDARETELTVSNLKLQVGELRLRLQTAEGNLKSARTDANRQYAAGRTAGAAAAKTTQANLHVTYSTGYREGWRAVFDSFSDPWGDDRWYVVKIEPSALGHRIATRVDVTPCQSMYESNGQIYLTGPACRSAK